jgi:ketosteroid isomerase-like protein
MKKVLFIMLCLCYGLMAHAQTKNEKDVAAAVESLKKAMIDGERQQLEKIVATDLSYGHSSGKIEDKVTFVEVLASGKSDFVTMDLTEQSIKVTGKTALVRHKLAAQTNDNGVVGNIKLGVLLVWQKQAGGWKLLGRQAFKLLNNFSSFGKVVFSDATARVVVIIEKPNP